MKITHPGSFWTHSVIKTDLSKSKVGEETEEEEKEEEEEEVFILFTCTINIRGY
jgi:hypothetical protein